MQDMMAICAGDIFSLENADDMIEINLSSDFFIFFLILSVCFSGVAFEAVIRCVLDPANHVVATEKPRGDPGIQRFPDVVRHEV